MRDASRRLLLFAILVTSLGASVVHYGAVGPSHDLTLVSHERLERPDAGVGKPIYVWATVVRHEATGTVVDAGHHTLRLSERLDAPPGATVQVAGELRPGGRLALDRAIVSPNSRGTLYAISAVGGLVAVGAFLRAWRLDRDALAFRPREGDDA